eukprot:2843345-Prymnesium_polylepis.1
MGSGEAKPVLGRRAISWTAICWPALHSRLGRREKGQDTRETPGMGHTMFGFRLGRRGWGDAVANAGPGP